MTIDKVTTFVQYEVEDDGDILFATPFRVAKVALPVFVAAPEMVLGFPDLTEGEIDNILSGMGADDSAEYNSGWDLWEAGVIQDHLEGLVLMGWLDAEAQYGDERTAERQLFAQTTRGQYWNS